jgi:hypothetical protein
VFIISVLLSVSGGRDDKWRIRERRENMERKNKVEFRKDDQVGQMGH